MASNRTHFTSWPAKGRSRPRCNEAIAGAKAAIQAPFCEPLLRRSQGLDPILRAGPDDYREHDRKILEHVQHSRESGKERYRHYGSASEIVLNFKRDLHSTAAKKVDSELARLRLPCLPDVEDEFLKLANQ